MDRILVTGASGFVGRAFIDFLEAEHKDMFDRLLIMSTSKLHPSIETVIVPKRELSALSQLKNYDIETVYHLGAFIPKSGAQANDIELCNENISFTSALLYALPASVESFVFTSTIDVYQSTTSVIDEQTPTIPAGGLYGWSKLYCERIVEIWSQEYSKTIQILRLGHIYGRGEDAYKKLIPETIKNLLSGKAPVVYSNGDEKRSFLHINDCVRAIFHSATIDSYVGPINVVSGRTVSILEIVNLLAAQCDGEVEVEILGKDIPTKDFVFDNSKMANYLGGEMMNLENGLSDEYQYIKELYG